MPQKDYFIAKQLVMQVSAAARKSIQVTVLRESNRLVLTGPRTRPAD
ncbi:hypothetical protein [Novipirellula herctigrandis]